MFLSFAIGVGLVLLDNNVSDNGQYTQDQVSQIIDEQSIFLLSNIALLCDTDGRFSIEIGSELSTFFCVNQEVLEGLEPTHKNPKGGEFDS